MKKKVFWVDDMRDPTKHIDTLNDDVYWAKNYTEFVSLLDFLGKPDVVYLDHDLGEGKSGRDCADYLVNFCLESNKARLPEYHSQSQNLIGKENILGIFKSYENFLKTK